MHNKSYFLLFLFHRIFVYFHPKSDTKLSVCILFREINFLCWEHNNVITGVYPFCITFCVDLLTFIYLQIFLFVGLRYPPIWKSGIWKGKNWFGDKLARNVYQGHTLVSLKYLYFANLSNYLKICLNISIWWFIRKGYL